MTTREFLEEIKKAVGGEIDMEEVRDAVAASGAFKAEEQGGPMTQSPRLRTTYRDMLVKFDFIVDGELEIAIEEEPGLRLLLIPENMVSKLLDKMHLSPEVKISDSDFNAKYQIRNIEKEKADSLFNEKVREIIHGLDPFIKLELTDKDFVLRKDVNLASYNPEQALKDLHKLMDLKAAVA